jgi:tetratricopeptide (TPR) repeat protein
MWNPFKKKPQQLPPGDPPPNCIDALANTLQREGRIEDLERELEKLDKAKLSTTELESWWHIYGIAAFRGGREHEATVRFEEAYRRFPGSPLIRFSLGQQYVNARQIDRGFELFQSCVFPEVPHAYVLAQVRYAYLWNRYDDGRMMLRPFFKAYQELKILDDHFLYVRGLPFFGVWWSYLAALSILSSDTKELETVTAYVSQNCHDYDFEYLATELVAYRDDQPQLMLPLVEKRLVDAQSDFPNGYSFMKRAVIKGRTAASQKEAEDLLNSVEIKGNDFPWLADIRTLAKAETAHRFSEPNVEKQHTNEFMTRQPMLFEPDIALNFHLLRYQERLKPGYQTN